MSSLKYVHRDTINEALGKADAEIYETASTSLNGKMDRKKKPNPQAILKQAQRRVQQAYNKPASTSLKQVYRDKRDCKHFLKWKE